MRLNTLSPAAGSKPEKKRLGLVSVQAWARPLVVVTRVPALVRAAVLASGLKAVKCR